MVNEKDNAIVLGGTFPHKLLITKLKQRGYFVILVDYLPNPSAKNDADIHLQESTLDKEKVLSIAIEYNVKLVISVCVDQANVTACYVAEKLGLPHPYTYEVSKTVTDKKAMKDIMVKNNIPTSKYNVVDKVDIENLDLSYPLIVKPVDSNSSKGVRRANNDQELEKYLRSALEISRDGRAIIEEYKIGREIGFDCLIQSGEVIYLMSRERRKMILNEKNPIQQIQGSFWPANLTDDIIEKFMIIAKQISDSFGLAHTTLMIQAIVNGNDISVIEFGARIGGGENYKIVELLTGYDIIEAGINSFFHRQMETNYVQPTEYISDTYIYVQPKVLGEIIGFEKAKEQNLIEYSNIYKVKGTQIGRDLSSNNRVGAFIVKASSTEKCVNNINQVLDIIEVYDEKGNPIMYKDIYSIN
ncbi:ATP-grasp domain-containing protein [uncultured Draconibacterium sp.]|uniref:ATP-grasp domain-containing protein n=1 Tax=uncultured Draconibacterium sp. TaxID=1573823 RepID=UPI0025E2B564|nr:ATP-grasp domain-containing protein [uncultured Draconibacterium sp.]